MIMHSLPPSQKNVLEILCAEGAMTHKDLVRISASSPRTLRYALKKLKEKNLLIEKLNMRDMRQIIYQYRLIPEENRGLADC
jgi:DNA-binding MarR family transcriptional regulator